MITTGSHPFLRQFYKTLFIVGFAALLLPSCSPISHLGPNAYLLNKNTVKSNKGELKEGVKSILKQKPNRRILGLFRFHLGVYTLANRGKSTRFKRWIKNTIGEEPVVLDPILTIKSNNQVLIYVQNEGYFNAVVTDTTIYYKSRKKAKVIYTITTGDRYFLRNIRYNIFDNTVSYHLLADSVNSKLKSGKPFRTPDFQAERERITTLLRNKGYYDFNQLYVTYDIDSSLKSFQTDVTINVAGTTITNSRGDSVTAGNHKFYRIKDVIVQTDYDPLSKTATVPTDTVIYKNYTFVSSFKKLQYKPEALLPRIFIESGDLYKINNSDYTYRGLANLSLFKFINIKFEPTTNDTADGNWLNSYILLTPAPKQDYKLEVEGTHNGGNFGFGGSLTYRNKNTFRGAESFETRFRVKVESIPDFADTTSDQTNPFLLNTYELGPEITVRVPRFLWPMSKFNRVRSSNPVTLFTVSYNYQQRPEYQRNLLILSSGFEFLETKFKKHYVYPAEINFSEFNLTDAFEQKLLEISDPQIQQQLQQYYRSYLITNGRYVFVYNSQIQNKATDFIFFRFTFEIAGNSLRLIDLLSRPSYKKTESYEINRIRYSQYVRPEFDARYYQVFSPNSSLVYRLASGIGLSYLNSEFVPYEKTYFAGGANDLRAFRPRTVGPGSYKTDNFIEQLGDIKINANIEYRSDIFKILEGAIFLDAGNIWVRKQTGNQPGGKFQARNFLSEFAIGTGLGLRFDFQFFIFRIDAGVPLKDPGRAKNDRWVFQYLKLRSVNYNFGIGYPF